MELQDSLLQNRGSPKLDDLPLELLDQIMLFLHPSLIRLLMLNRKLWIACEALLYRYIDVGNHPYRSLYLLNTFALRPDLALLVRQLSINLAWLFPRLKADYKIPHILQPDGLAALSLAKNIRSLELAGLDWLSNPSLAHICDMVAQMELISLTIDEPLYTTWNGPRIVQMLTSNLRLALLSQPKLEYLSLKFHREKAALLNSIEAEDVPHLNRFREDARFARAFLNVASKLRTLDLVFEFDEPSYDPFRESLNGTNIKILRIEMRFKAVRDWAVFGEFLANFPNTESLHLLSRDLCNEEHIPFYSDKIAPLLRVLPQLRKLEVRPWFSLYTAHPGPTPEFLLKFKKHCPTLERFVDTREREWAYVPSSGDDGSFIARPECRLVERLVRHRFDLRTPVWDV